MGDQELADLILSDLIPAQACVLAVASCPGMTDVLIAAFSGHTGARQPSPSPTLPDRRQGAGDHWLLAP